MSDLEAIHDHREWYRIHRGNQSTSDR